MEPRRPEPPEVELLEDGPPGTLERVASSLARHRGVRVAGALAIAVAIGAALSAELLRDGPDPVPDPVATAPVSTSPLRGWEVLGRPEVNPESPVYVVMFRAANRSDRAQNPRSFVAVGSFAGDAGFRFSATCTGFDNDAAGVPRPVRSMVEPGEEITVRCADTMEYSGNRPELVPRSLEIQALTG